MPDKHRDVPESMEDSATALAMIIHQLGFGGDKLPGLLDRADKFLAAAGTEDAADALEDDLDGWSVAVGFAAGIAVYANCVGVADAEKQMRKAKDN